MIHIWKLVVIIAVALTSTGAYFVIAYDDKISSQTILETDKTVIGQDIQYPFGSPLITSKIVTIPIGTETGVHAHEYPMFGYVLEGEITVDYGEQGIKTFAKGDSLIEAIDHVHNGKNTGNEHAKLLVVVIGEK